MDKHGESLQKNLKTSRNIITTKNKINKKRKRKKNEKEKQRRNPPTEGGYIVNDYSTYTRSIERNSTTNCMNLLHNTETVIN